MASEPFNVPSIGGPNRRGCYCSLWHSKPALLESQGVPRGYCGLCIRCGRPGHLRHAPGAIPATLAFCDTCYRVAAFRQYAIWAFALALLVGCYVFVRFLLHR